jgi:UDP-N-acetyl-D-glucosamine dehydrogenase
VSGRHNDFAVIGLGYVGLPLVQAAVGAGLRGLGVDASQSVVDSLNGGHSHVDDLSDEDVDSLLRAGFLATSDPLALRGADVVVICVPTPLATEGGPDLSAVIAAARAVRDNLTPGVLVVLESTTWPGTTEEVVLPILEESGLRAGVEFDLAFSPERIDPGNGEYRMSNTPKVVGGCDARSTARAAALYGQFIERVVEAAGTREAEMSKLLENTYRQVNIALVNEMAKFSHELGIDFWDVIRCASTKPFGFQPFYPGPGVGGHCIPIDPSYLSHQVRERLGYPFRFVELAQEVNRSMPSYVAARAFGLLQRAGVAEHGAKVLLLGVTYKAGISDQRESPALPLARELLDAGMELSFYDPFVERWDVDGRALPRVADLGESLALSDLAVHLQPHPEYGNGVLSAARTRVLDTRGLLEGPNIERL